MEREAGWQMARVDWKRFGGDIRHNEISGAYFLYGSEQYLLSRYLSRFLKRAVPSMEAFNLQRFEMEKGKIDWNSIEDAAQNLPMFSPKKVVLLKNFNPEQMAADEIKRVEKLVAELPETTLLMMSLTGAELSLKKSRQAANFVKFMETNGTVVEFVPLGRYDLAKYMIDEAGKRGCFLSSALADRMVEYCGADLTALLANLEKLIAFTGKGEVRPEALDELVEKAMEATAFDLANAVLRGDLDRALRVVAELKEKRAEPVMVAGAVNSAFVDLYRAKCALGEKKPAAQIVSDFDYSPRVRFRVDNAMRSAGRMEMSALRRGIRLLHELDLDLKSSRADPFELLEITLVRIQTGQCDE